MPAQDDAFENRLNLTPDDGTFLRDARLIDLTFSRSRNSTVNQFDAGEVVGECRNAKRFDRSFANHASGARARCRDGRVSNQFVCTVLARGKCSHVLVKHSVDLHVFVTHVCENLVSHLFYHANRRDILRAMALLGISKTDALHTLPYREQRFENIRDDRDTRWY